MTPEERVAWKALEAGLLTAALKARAALGESASVRLRPNSFQDPPGAAGPPYCEVGRQLDDGAFVLLGRASTWEDALTQATAAVPGAQQGLL